MPGVAPQEAYGHQVIGASKTQTLEMRVNIKTATPFGGTQACLTSTLALLVGLVADPGVKNPCEQLDSWVMSWEKLDATDRRETRVTWALALGKIVKGKKLTQTKGPVEATIAALMHLGWKPAAPDLWIVRGPGGETKATIRLDGKTYTRFQITAQAQADAQDILWKSAAKHAHGKGLEGGTPSFEPARRAIRYFRRNGHHEAARALEYVIVGIFKPNATEGKWGI